MELGMPKVSVTFSELASSAIERSAKGVVGLILVESGSVTLSEDPLVLYRYADAPEGLSAHNLQEIELAFTGYSGATPEVVITLVKTGDDGIVASDKLQEACDKFLNTDVVYIAAPDAGKNVTGIVQWLGSVRNDTSANDFKAVLAGAEGSDNKIVINYKTEKNQYGDNTLTAAEYTPRIAAMFATCPMTASCTYHVLSDLTSVEAKKDTELEEEINKGNLVAKYDGSKVKICRAVNTLTTTNQTISDQQKFVRNIDILDMIKHDVTVALEDNYVGKYLNDADGKQAVINAVNSYFEGLILDKGISSGYCEFSFEKARIYLESKYDKKKVAAMTNADIMNENFGTKLFLKGAVRPLNAIEDIEFEITVE